MTWLINDNQILPTKKYSKKLINFTCNCKYQTQKTMPWKNYATKLSKSCGKCNFISTDDIIHKKFGKLKLNQSLEPNKPISKNTKLNFICECGNNKEIILKSVLNNLTKSCGCLLIGKSDQFSNSALNFTGPKVIKTKSKINYKSEDWWTSQSFGKLKVIAGQGQFALASDKLISCQCKCGNITKVRAAHLVKSTKSCGKCNERAAKWWAEYDNTSYPKNLKELKKALYGSFILPQTYSKGKIEAICKLCNSTFTPKFHDIFLKKIKSCGCINSKISQPVLDIAEFLSKHNIKHTLEKRLENWNVDIFCEDANLAIDFNGLYYHSSKISDRSKVEHAKYCDITKTHKYIIIYEDEWRTKSEIFKELILNKCNKNIIIHHIRPQKCSMQLIDSAVAFDFYNKHHYLGGRYSKHSIGLLYKNELISLISFNPPSRQSKFDLELVRMTSQSRIKAYGCWSYMFGKLKSFNIHGKIVSFSDNRLFDGNIYQMLGFKLDGFVNPDYYYTNGRHRVHKSNMRKTKSERLIEATEEELRRNQGWYKIWDVGKKRWIIKI